MVKSFKSQAKLAPTGHCKAEIASCLQENKKLHPSIWRNRAQSPYRPVIDYLLIGEGHPFAITLTLYRLSVKNTLAQGTRHKAQGDSGHMPPASLGQYAPLSFVVIGRRQKGFFVGAAFPVLPVPGLVPGSLSKGSRDFTISTI